MIMVYQMKYINKNKNKRRICVFTGTRADYGLLKWTMHELLKDNRVTLQVIASGTHFSKEFGMTYKEIEKDGFSIDCKVDLNIFKDDSVNIARIIGYGTKKFSLALKNLKPDIIVILGDRYEALAMAQSAMIMKIPLAHIHGGESTEGAIDEAIRHSITKMSHIHFTSADLHKKRVIQMGEKPENVFNTGAPGLDNISKLKLLSKKELEKILQTKFKENIFLVSYHPATLDTNDTLEPLKSIFEVLKKIYDSTIILSKSNADSGGLKINKYLEELTLKNKDIILRPSYGQLIYLSILKQASLIIGNSSSGIIEAPYLGTPTLNIGNRQLGRLRAPSVIDCSVSTKEIYKKTQESLSKKFQIISKECVSPFGLPGASKKIAKKLIEINLNGILYKKFYDIKGAA